jgi:hypothetical protein
MTNAYSAASGRSAGGVINPITRTGTNELHGSLFEFVRNGSFDAKNFFDSRTAPVPAFRRNQFGGQADGAIVRNKTFFLGSFEELQQRPSRHFPARSADRSELRRTEVSRPHPAARWPPVRRRHRRIAVAGVAIDRRVFLHQPLGSSHLRRDIGVRALHLRQRQSGNTRWPARIRTCATWTRRCRSCRASRSGRFQSPASSRWNPAAPAPLIPTSRCSSSRRPLLYARQPHTQSGLRSSLLPDADQTSAIAPWLLSIQRAH